MFLLARHRIETRQSINQKQIAITKPKESISDLYAHIFSTQHNLREQTQFVEEPQLKIDETATSTPHTMRDLYTYVFAAEKKVK